MIGKIVGAIAGKHISQNVHGGSGVGGALLGAGAVAAIRRLGPAALVAAAIGGYVFKKQHEKQQAAADADEAGSAAKPVSKAR